MIEDAEEVLVSSGSRKVQPLDTAFGTDNNLYEVFGETMDYFAASEFCIQRGATLSPYITDAQQVFVDILCDASIGMKCWVGGKQEGSQCSVVDGSAIKPQACTKKAHVVCSKAVAV